MALVKIEYIIKAEDGKVVQQIIERGGIECSRIKQFGAEGIGRELSDESTGPESDDVHEVARL